MDTEVIDHYFYSKEHEWINIDDEVATVGISDYAQNALGDITYIELPEVDSELDQFEQFASVESVKAASDIYCPMPGRVTEVNDELDGEPGLINKFCYTKGWIAKIEITDKDVLSNLMTADEYRKYLEGLDS